MSVAQITDQTNCGRAGTQRGTSDACAACSGCGEDHENMRRTRWRVRIERICSPPAMQLKRAGRQVEEAISQRLRMGPSSTIAAIT